LPPIVTGNWRLVFALYSEHAMNVDLAQLGHNTRISTNARWHHVGNREYLMQARRLLLTAVLILLISPPFARSEQSIPSHANKLKQDLQAVVSLYLKQRGAAEQISGVALRVDNGNGSPVEVYAGTFGRTKQPIDGQTLFQIGSNTKHFTAALILKLEALGKLSIDDTVGKWLPQYPEWSQWTIRQLLNMTTTIPNYSETVEIGKAEAADPNHQFTPQDLIDAARNPGLSPPNAGWFYSNTNNILAGLIIEKAAHMSYAEALRTYILTPLGLHDTFYSDGPYSASVLRRLPQGIYDNPECLLYQPQPCTLSTLAPLLGHDMSRQNLSWAGPAGAIISTPADLGIWIRDLFGLKLFPRKQLDEMTAIVSQKTGKPISDVNDQDPIGFALDLGRAYKPDMGGGLWFYQGTTLGFRAVFAYWPQDNLVITSATNSQPPGAQDKFMPFVIGGAYKAVKDAMGR
jgi:D-alanyl-D-alanine carboxypeptidase